MNRGDDRLPLFSSPEGGPVERIGPHSAEARAFEIGFTQGAKEQTKIACYDPNDERVNRYYNDGYRIGRLFRPIPGVERSPHRRRR